MEISLSKLDRESVVIEEYREFENSVFSSVYQKTEILLHSIINENENGNGKKKKREIENVISFEGRRGTGKTSAMLSIQNALRKYDNNNFLKTGIREKKYFFHVLDAIDASMLEDGEDILELVLANMFTDFRQMDQRNDIQGYNKEENTELYQLFDKIFGSLMNLKRHDRKSNDASPLYALTQLSNSQTLSVKIEELIDRYLRYMNFQESYGGYGQQNFLVVTIDDLDMHFKEKMHTSYDMLETIHRYLTVPGIIVLVSYNYMDLCLACEKHFRDLYLFRNSAIDKDEDRLHIQELATEYLNKVCPIYSRVHMPSLRKKDYQKKENIEVLVSPQKGERILNPFKELLWPDKNNDVKLSVKRFLFLLKASCGGLYYDAAGRKKHFAEPGNLRELSQMYTFYQQLDKIQDDTETKEHILFKELLDDLYFRFAGEKLLFRTDREKFKTFLDVSIERRSRDIVEDIRSIVKEKEGRNSFSQITYRGNKQVLSYSYGELLYGLHMASFKNYYCKELVWCILDSYTIMLTRLYRQMRGTDADKAEEAGKVFSQIIGASVSSSWSNRFMPAVKIKRDENEEDYAGEPDQTITEKKDKDLIVSAAAIKCTLVSGEWTFNLEEDGEPGILRTQLRNLEMLLMFFTEVRKESDREKGFDIKYIPGKLNPESVYNQSNAGTEEEKKKKREENTKIGPRFVFRFSDVCFNIMNFVGNSFLWKTFFESTHTSLRQWIEEYLGDLRRAGKITEAISDSYIDTFINENSLQKEFKDWHENKGSYGFAMPLYSFDMMYNIFKRRYQRQDALPEAVPPDKYWGYVKSVYYDFGELLKEQDEFYFRKCVDNDKVCPDTGEREDTEYRFYHRYTDCPFIQWIRALEKDETLEKRFADQFGTMISAMAQTPGQ